MNKQFAFGWFWFGWAVKCLMVASHFWIGHAPDLASQLVMAAIGFCIALFYFWRAKKQQTPSQR